MVAGFCISYQYRLVDICYCGVFCDNNCLYYYKFPGNKSSNCKPHEKFKDRIGRPLRSPCGILSLKNKRSMFKNYFKTAWRNLWKNKLSACISVVGLATGMACCILISIYIKDEMSYNNGNTQLQNIYRINWITKQGSNPLIEATTPIIIAPSLTPSITG